MVLSLLALQAIPNFWQGSSFRDSQHPSCNDIWCQTCRLSGHRQDNHLQSSHTPTIRIGRHTTKAKPCTEKCWLKHAWRYSGAVNSPTCTVRCEQCENCFEKIVLIVQFYRPCIQGNKERLPLVRVSRSCRPCLSRKFLGQAGIWFNQSPGKHIIIAWAYKICDVCTIKSNITDFETVAPLLRWGKNASMSQLSWMTANELASLLCR